uniref:chromosome-associated kinesin KIF4-like n=1 Tax=Myxine glutinosa TaxID=7769 RepID=UPI00358F8609
MSIDLAVQGESSSVADNEIPQEIDICFATCYQPSVMEEQVIPVRVAIRCRPLVPRELAEGCKTCISFVPGEPQIIVGTEKAFTFDYTFDPATEQEEVFNVTVVPLLRGIFNGYNATVLAYGQTGSGKTFTMGGTYTTSQDDYEVGVIPRVIHHLFDGISQRSEIEFVLKVSYLEIYNEEIIDLLHNSKEHLVLSIREDAKEDLKVAGLTEKIVCTAEEMVRCLELGNSARSVGSTAMNAQSSRSHAIFTISMEQKRGEQRDSYCCGKFHLVDLAGSERQKKTKAEGDRLKEGININRGLLCLGNVISALGEDSGRKNHIPYRDSKLTRMLQDSLGGNSHTLMVACISPADAHLEETVNTLRYADRARKIKNKPIVNRDPQAAEMLALKQQVQQLRVQLLQATGGRAPGAAQKALHFLTPPDYTFLPSPEEDIAFDHGNEEREQQLTERNVDLRKHVDRLVRQTSQLSEKVVLLEMQKEKVQKSIQDVKQHEGCGVDISAFAESLDVVANGGIELRKPFELLQNLQSKITELEDYDDLVQDINMPANEISEGSGDESFSVQHAGRQAELSRELLQLDQTLAMKEELARRVALVDKTVLAVNGSYQDNILELEKKVENLEREKEEQHAAAKKESIHAKISEKRRKRLQDLESEMASLKKKIVEQTKLLKHKQSSDKTVSKLNDEIQVMKSQRVHLLKRMKDDSVKFRQWRVQKDHEVQQLKQKERKHQFEVLKMERGYEKQAAVLRRKTEEAAAANRRLRDALQQQKEAGKQRKGQQQRSKEGMAARIKGLLTNEVEVLVSMEEARCRLNDLLDDRKLLARDLAQLQHNKEDISQPIKKSRQRTFVSRELEQDCEIDEQIKSLETEMELRSAQIADLQQKLSDADGDERVRFWDGFSLIIEAKYALKWFMKEVVATRVRCGVKEREVVEFTKQFDQLQKQVSQERQQASEAAALSLAQLSAQAQEHQDQMMILLNQRQQEAEDKQKALNVSDEPKTPPKVKKSFRSVGPTAHPRGNTPRYALHEILSDETDSDDEVELQNQRYSRRCGKFDSDWSPSITKPQQRTSQLKCGCGGACNKKMCSCRKQQGSCSDSCGCNPEKCTNRSPMGSCNDKEHGDGWMYEQGTGCGIWSYLAGQAWSYLAKHALFSL